MIHYMKKSWPLSTYVSQGVLNPLQHLFIYRFFCNHIAHAYFSCWTVNFRGQELCLSVTCLVRYLQPLMRYLAHSRAQQIWYLCVERYTWSPYRVVPLGCDLGSQAPSRVGVKMRWVNTGKATGTDKLLNDKRPLFDCPQEVMAPALWNAGPAYLWRRA